MGNYRTNISKKPKGFKFVKRNVYEYQVEFRLYGLSGDLYTTMVETVPTTYIYVEYGYKKIDLKKFAEILYKKFNIKIPNDDILSYVNKEMFRRDGIVCPFISYMNVPLGMTDNYLKNRLLRNRLLKIKNIKRKSK